MPPKTRKFDGKVFRKADAAQNMREAERIKENCQERGFNVRIVPSGSRATVNKFDIFIDESPSRMRAIKKRRKMRK